VKNPPAHRRAVRRLIAGLAAAIVGAVGSLALVTPSQAAIPCELTYEANFWSDPWQPGPQFEVSASIKNTGPVTSTNWVVYISLPPGTSNNFWWGVQPMPEYGDGWFSATSYDRALPPGASAQFAFYGTTTPENVGGTVSMFVCSIG